VIILPKLPKSTYTPTLKPWLNPLPSTKLSKFAKAKNKHTRPHTHTQPKQILTRNKKKTTSHTTQKHTQLFPLAINNPSPKPSPKKNPQITHQNPSQKKNPTNPSPKPITKNKPSKSFTKTHHPQKNHPPINPSPKPITKNKPTRKT
jgi:hypothetical protein